MFLLVQFITSDTTAIKGVFTTFEKAEALAKSIYPATKFKLLPDDAHYHSRHFTLFRLTPDDEATDIYLYE